MSGDRYEIRIVDEERRVFVRFTSHYSYAVAVLIADMARAQSDAHIVVLDSHAADRGRPLYDSRKIKRAS